MLYRIQISVWFVSKSKYHLHVNANAREDDPKKVVIDTFSGSSGVRLYLIPVLRNSLSKALDKFQ